VARQALIARPSASRSTSDAGFTLIDTLVVVAIICLVSAIALPSTTSMMSGYKLKGSAQAINNLVGLAKMRAAAQFSRARVYADLGARTFRLQVWNKTTNQWVDDSGTTPLADGVTFGFTGITQPPPNTQAALGQSPAVWTVAALALLLYAAGSRYAVAGWAALAGFFALGQLGELLDLPAAVTGLSPYTHLPAMPVEPFAPTAALTMTALAAVILGAAWWRFRERDIR